MLKLYNTLSRSIEDFQPLNSPRVGMYSCGPTVYDYQHIGHMRRYVGDDILVRVLKQNNFDVKQVMNITDVGHLTSDSDTGEDKMEEGAKKHRLSVWDVAKKFEQQFWESMDALHVVRPNVVMKATDHIQDQIELINILVEKGYTYKTSDGIYFDTSKFPNHSKLVHQKENELRAGARVDLGEKKNATDFALWKFSFPNGRSFDSAQDASASRRQMEWESPFGIGFPGWHIECSAMSIKELGPTFDIHTGGIDHIPIHHQNEIIQSEAASGQPFVKYWVHHAFLLVDGQKMSKSLGNIVTVHDVTEKGFDPMNLRYLYLQTHYRQEMNFTFEALEAAQTSLNRLRTEIEQWDEPSIGCAEFEQQFNNAVNDDLNVPKALAVVWELVKSDYPTSARAQSLFKMDKVLGLGLKKVQSSKSKFKNKEESIPEEIQKLVEERAALRKQKSFHLADGLRHKIKKLGYDIADNNGDTTVKKITS